MKERNRLGLGTMGMSIVRNVQSLIGTTNPAHLHAAIDAQNIELTAEDITRIETALDANKVGGKGMRNFVFTDGIMSLAK